ncbi:DgyrCDS7958 [Dimorphilus gyrociliatus]|uniref:DgyrCDS7958 n=1 Tax=Dimorphilus gyrociliatus TaxID=2664684 RepID=A0A7I8VTR9_9ANNE|nr:DgyrCDS7958 [Dimorphilus gyrociliatus]
MQQRIRSNSTEDVVTTSYERTDGALIDHIIDFKNQLQIFRIFQPGEIDLGYPYQSTFCFVTREIKNEFISSDAISKLRQKNPQTIRVAEEDKGWQLHEMTFGIDLSKSEFLSPILKMKCKVAQKSTFIGESDLKYIASSTKKDFTKLMEGTYAPVSSNIRCRDAKVKEACKCRLDICNFWYPCSLKMCKGQDELGNSVVYRCGIHTCRKCRVFEFMIDASYKCPWDILED